MRIFEQVFGPGDGEIRLFFAPGRVNLIGEHTDYTGGLVFPAALTYGTWVAIRKRRDRTLRLASTAFSLRVERTIDDLDYRIEDGWANYVKGVVRELAGRGVELSGCEMLFHGNIPSGAGLSSSASILLVTARALSDLFDLRLEPLKLAQLCKQVENSYVGVNCGIMDQFAVAMGKKDHAMLLRCNTLEYHYVPLALGDYRLVIINSNKQRQLAESRYNERRQECEAGFAMLKQHLPLAADLGGVTMEMWMSVRHKITSGQIKNRLEHVISENDRVRKSVEALEKGDVHAFGQYMLKSHISLRDLYEVTGRELDALVEEAYNAEGCIGARMTGAGFGGCTVNLVHRDWLEEFQHGVTEGYREKTGLVPDFYFCGIGDGAREIAREVEPCPF